jgi:hypothetical protein
MHGKIPADAQVTIFPADTLVSERLPAAPAEPITVQLDSESSGWFAKLARKLWRQKPAAALAFLTGEPERQCYRYTSLEKPQEPPASLMVDLLRGTDGGRVLHEIMVGSDAGWWLRYQSALTALPLVEQLRQLALPLK